MAHCCPLSASSTRQKQVPITATHVYIHIKCLLPHKLCARQPLPCLCDASGVALQPQQLLSCATIKQAHAPAVAASCKEVGLLRVEGEAADDSWGGRCGGTEADTSSFVVLGWFSHTVGSVVEDSIQYVLNLFSREH
jgi:hypothetical protein